MRQFFIVLKKKKVKKKKTKQTKSEGRRAVWMNYSYNIQVCRCTRRRERLMQTHDQMQRQYWCVEKKKKLRFAVGHFAFLHDVNEPSNDAVASFLLFICWPIHCHVVSTQVK